MVDPPEVVFDRFLRNNIPAQYRGTFKGKLDLEAVLEPDVRTLLIAIQSALNEALRNEKRDVLEHVPHPPIHFDYVEASVSNAIAFRSEQYSFIGVTMPLVCALWDSCAHLSRSTEVAALLGTALDPESQEKMISLLFATQLTFVVSHEYTHIVHGTLATAPDSIFVDDFVGAGEGSLMVQAHEIDADGYGVYHLLEDLLNGARRSQSVKLLDLEAKPETVQEAILFASFVIAVGAFFYIRPPIAVDSIDVYELDHPPQAARMNFVMHYATTWAKQKRPHLASGMTLDRFQQLLYAVASATWGMNGSSNWQTQTAFLQSEEGSTYINELDRCVKKHIQGL
jgi:hypothetical protein